MTIATKNGVPIIKDGSIATGCGCCEGGWYCCQNLQCAVADVSSVAVSITPASQSYVTQYRYREYDCGGAAAYYQRVVAVPLSSISGSFALTKQPQATFGALATWKATLPQDSVGCFQPVITLSFFQTSGLYRWRISISNPSYAWVRYTRSGTQPFKSLSDMQCQTTPGYTGTLTGCAIYNNEFEQYFAGLYDGIDFTKQFECSPTGATAFQSNAYAFSPAKSSDEKSPPQDANSVDTVSGSLLCSVGVTIS